MFSENPQDLFQKSSAKVLCLLCIIKFEPNEVEFRNREEIDDGEDWCHGARGYQILRCQILRCQMPGTSNLDRIPHIDRNR